MSGNDWNFITCFHGPWIFKLNTNSIHLSKFMMNDQRTISIQRIVTFHDESKTDKYASAKLQIIISFSQAIKSLAQ